MKTRMSFGVLCAVLIVSLCVVNICGQKSCLLCPFRPHSRQGIPLSSSSIPNNSRKESQVGLTFPESEREMLTTRAPFLNSESTSFTTDLFAASDLRPLFTTTKNNERPFFTTTKRSFFTTTRRPTRSPSRPLFPNNEQDSHQDMPFFPTEEIITRTQRPFFTMTEHPATRTAAARPFFTTREAHATEERASTSPAAPPLHHTTANPQDDQWPQFLPRRCGIPFNIDKIIGGTAVPYGSYPWLASLFYQGTGIGTPKLNCAGTIINSRYILTAAHCVANLDEKSYRLESIHLNDLDVNGENDCILTRLGVLCYGSIIKAGFEEILVHPGYNRRGEGSDDIALIRLNITLDFDSDDAVVGPICLPVNGLSLIDLDKDIFPIAVGWGITENGNYSNILLRTQVPVVSNKVCKSIYKDKFVAGQICAGGVKGKGTCGGDSGGPLFLAQKYGPPYTQYGIVSFGFYPCALENYPGVYTNVRDYMSWIISMLRP